MKIVIDIDKTVYKTIKETMQTTNRHLGKTMMLEHLMEVISDGTPLPKDHGRLVDADALKLTQHDIYVESINYRHRCISVENVDEAPTIIEADKEVEDNG